MIEDIYPLSPMQQGMLFHSVYAAESSIYFEQLSCVLRGELNVAALKRAWQEVLDRHAVLRSSFAWEDLEEPVQIVERDVSMPITEMDWRTLSTDEQNTCLTEFLVADRAAGFDLREAPLMRVALIQKSAAEHQLVWSHHHSLLDGWSLPLLLHEVFSLYESHSRGKPAALPPARPFRDYIAWLQKQDMASAEMFWREYLRGCTEPTPLALARTSSSVAMKEYGEQRVILTPALTEKLVKLTRSYQLTLNTVFQGAWALLLSRYSGEREVMFGATVSGRPAEIEGIEKMLGLFINTQPVRVEVNGEQKVGDWLRQLQDRCAAARQYEYAPLSSLQRWSEIGSGRALFDSLLVFENFPVDSELGQEIKGSISIADVSSFRLTNYPLMLMVSMGRQLRLLLNYDQSLFTDKSIERLLGHVKVLLEVIADGPEKCLSELSPLTASERRELILTGNATDRQYPAGVCLHELFERQVNQMPDAIAVVTDRKQLSYQELNAEANRLAHRLKTLGVGPEVRIAIMMERSVELVVAILAVLKAGGAYVPLDPDYPEKRLRYILEDCRPAVLLSTSEQWKAAGLFAPVLWVDQETLLGESTDNLDLELDATSLAYVIYTSGSTGNPKGAMNEHRGIVNRLLWMLDEYPLDRQDAVLQKTSFSFDVSVWEIFWPLLVGARLVLAAPGGQRDTAYLAHLIQSARVTTVHFVPSLFRVFLEEPQAANCCHALRRVICSGEELGWTTQERFFEVLKDVELHNLYGPTETAVEVTSWRCEQGSSLGVVPIGWPVANTQVYVLDDRMEAVPLGVAGELYIGGTQVGRGYWQRAELTAEKFVPDPFTAETGRRLYRSGDLVRRLDGGEIEFLGRTDQQVKVRGFRIELNEIESALCRHPQVRECAVVAHAEESGAGRLVAYVVGAEELASAELMRFLRQSLPEYMVPATFVFLSQLPLTPNGKLDRNALPKPDRSQSEDVFAPPTTPVEEELANLWIDLLHLERVSIHDNFFELGGDSLLTIQVVSRIRSSFGLEVPIAEIFYKPTIKQLAEKIEELFLASSDTDKLAELLGQLEDI